MARARWISGGIRTRNFPLNDFSEIGAGGDFLMREIDDLADLVWSVEN
jgi:hypothetical protein